jgi:hypothetical protein
MSSSGPEHIQEQTQERVKRRDRMVAWGFTAGVHLAVLAALLWPRHAPKPVPPAPSTLMVSVADEPKPAPPGPPDMSDPGGQVVAPAMPHPVAPTFQVASTPAPDNSDLLSASQIAGAASVGEGTGGGGGGGGCDMARAVQQALRRDPLVRSAVQGANRLGKAVMMWNGDWVRSGVQDGKGLSAVREAISWEVAFAPEACRNQPMHGLVLLSLADGTTRFAIGAGSWRWTDLLGVRGASATIRQ